MDIQNTTRITGFTALFILVAITLGLISFIPTENNFELSIIKTLQVIAFLTAGVGYLLILARFDLFPDNERRENWIFTSMLSFLIFCSLLLLYFINNRSLPIMALSSTCAFLLPYIINQVWKSYDSIFKEINSENTESVKHLQVASNVSAREKDENLTYFKSSNEKDNSAIINQGALKSRQLQTLKEEYGGKLSQQQLQFQQQKSYYEADLKKQYDQRIQEEINNAAKQMRNRFEQALLEEKKTYEGELAKLKDAHKKNFEQYELDIKSKYDTILLSEKEAMQQEIVALHKKIKSNEEEIYNKLMIEHADIQRRDKEGYESNLKNEIERVKKEEKEMYDKQLFQAQLKENQSEKNKYEEIRKQVEARIKSNEREAYEITLKSTVEKIKREEKELYKQQLLLDQQRIIQKEKELAKTDFDRQQRDVLQKEKGNYENLLRQDHERIQQREKENYQYELRKEIERVKQKEKEVFETKLKSEVDSLKHELHNKYKTQLASEAEIIKQQEASLFERKLSKNKIEINDSEKEIFQKKLYDEVEKITAEKNMVVKNLNDHYEEILQEEKKKYESKSAEDQERFLEKQDVLKEDLQEKFLQEKNILINDFGKRLDEVKMNAVAEKQNLKIEHDAIVQKGKENYKIQSLKEIDKIFKEQNDFMAQSQQNFSQEKDELIKSFQKKLEEEIARAKAEKDSAIKSIKSAHEEIMLKEKINYTSGLAKQADKTSTDQNNFELQVKKFDEEKKDLLRAFEKKLKEENEAIQAEKNAIIESLQEQLLASRQKIKLNNNSGNDTDATLQKDLKEEIAVQTEAAEPETLADAARGKSFYTTDAGLNKKGTPWIYIEPENDHTRFIFLNSVSLYVQIHVNNGDSDNRLFSIKVPLDIELGNAFKYFMSINKKAHIETRDKDNSPYKWKFYSTGFLQLGHNELNPYESLKKNKIKEGKTIIAVRIKDE